VNREEHRANVHVGPDDAESYQEMGLWRKGGREVVEWVDDGVDWRDLRRVVL